MSSGKNTNYSMSNEERSLNHSEPNEEDDNGYPIPLRERKMSSVIMAGLPSKHLGSLFGEDTIRGTAHSEAFSALRRKDSALRSIQLKNATLSSRQTDMGVEKIFEVLSALPNANTDEKLKTLREINQTLAIKKEVKQLLDIENREMIATQQHSLWRQLKLKCFMGRDKLMYEIKNIAYYLEPWQSSIKTIQGKYGSGVASYFIFLRWLLYMNLWNFFVTFCFVIIPQLSYEASKSNDTVHSHNQKPFEMHDILTGSGSFDDSGFYFGHYTHVTFQAIPYVYYSMPLAYLLTIGVNFLINLIAISSSMTASYQKNFVDSAGELKHVFCNTIFSAWDYTIETESAARLRREAFCNEVKEILFTKEEGQAQMTTRQKIIQRTCLVVVSIICYACIGGIGYLIYYLLQEKSLKVDIKILSEMTLPLTVTFIASASYFLLKFSSDLELYLSNRIKLYISMVRVVSLRIVMLGIIVYFWMVIYKPPRNENVCYENKLGEEIYRLILVNFLVTVLIFTLVIEFSRTLVRKFFPSVQKPEFDVAYNILDLLYYQTLAWIAIYSVPIGSLMIIVILVLLYYLKKLSLSMNCQPPKRSWSLDEAHTFYLVLTFVMFFFTSLAVAYSVFGTETSSCGPFQMYKTVGEMVMEMFKDHEHLNTFVEYLISNPVLFAILCFIGIIVYQMRAQANAHISVIKKTREQLLSASKDKVFLLKLFDEAFNKKYKKHD